MSSNYYQQTAGNQEGFFGRKDTSAVNVLQSNQSSSGEQMGSQGKPESMVVMTNRNIGTLMRTEKVFEPQTNLIYPMMCRRLGVVAMPRAEFRVSIGHANNYLNNQGKRVPSFGALEENVLKKIAQAGCKVEEKLYVAMRIAWSKCGGPIYEEELPFESQKRWAEERLQALYFGRRVDSQPDGEYAPKHGVDFYVFPLEVIEESERKAFLEDYLEGALGYSMRRQEAKAHVQKNQKKFGEACGKIAQILNDDDRRQKEQEALEEKQRREGERRIRNMPIGAVIGSMNTDVASRPSYAVM